MAENCSHNCSTCGKECESRTENQSMLIHANKNSKIKKVIGVISGKGGVGKSSVTCGLAVLMQRMGYKTAVLDADMTGPSVPKAFGLYEEPEATDDALYAVETKTGIKIMSINLLLGDETAPVLWRGPIIKQEIVKYHYYYRKEYVINLIQPVKETVTVAYQHIDEHIRPDNKTEVDII